MKVVSVSYLNTLPYIQGLEKSGFKLTKAYPSRCADLLHQGETDIALIPVGALQEGLEYFILSEYGIGADGPVRTVALFGKTPLSEWDQVVLDYQSRTSVLLTKLLFKKYWRKSIRFQKGKKGYEENLEASVGGLIIGDRAFQYEGKYPYCYDLSKAWRDWTGLPFIFAVWVSLKELPSSSLRIFSDSLESGLQNFKISPSISKLSDDIESYYTDNISYRLTPRHWSAFQKYNELLGRKKLKINRL